MQITGEYTIPAPRQVVWELLNDPAALARMIPGAEKLEPAGENRYTVALKVGIAAIKGSYQGMVTIDDATPPESYTLVVEGKGAPGFVRGRGRIVLAEHGPSETAVHVDGDAQVGGPIAGVGQRLAGAGAKLLMNEFFRALDAEARRRATST